ncbi:MAG: type VI secretion system membrane subunit TssM [Planctomycetes bacterium]|nr:type VI secretion system membrane subunit TssM [Planctomycetota bacterium]
MTMGRLLQNLLSQRYAGLLGIAVLVLVLYLVGVLGGVDWLWLHVAAAAVGLGAFAAMFWQQRRAAKGASALEAALKAQGQSHAASARPDQRAGIEELKSTFDESLDLLRSSKMGRGALHTIPWYILIGPPGSGKSTLLRESGLSFPYMTKGRSAIRGLGGTKNCDWWFADRGILLDTAGRYTTEAEDRDEWMAFLRMMKRGRGRRPINGAIVAVGLAEIVEASDTELQRYAENVRDRIDELTRELQVVFPIYLVFTKCDRLRGFVETFDTLNKDQRRQVWGFTFPFDRARDFSVPDQFGKEFDELYKALCVRRVELLANDHFKKRKAQVYAFPLQFLHLKERLQGFLAQVQQPNPYQEVSPVRGIYFTSGTQEGTTIDKILKVLRPAELELDVPQEARRCYFVDDVFNRVVFPDATLAAPTAQALRRDRQLRIGGAIGLAVLALVVVVWRWSVMAEFAAACNRIEHNIVHREVKDPQVMRNALDAQLHMLTSDNHHLARGGVVDNLALHYGRTLVTYAIERIDTFAKNEAEAVRQSLAAIGPVTDANRQQAYAVVRAGEQRLARIDAGVRGIVSGADEGRAPALALWRDAVGDDVDAIAHLDRLRAAGERELEVPALAGAVRTTRDELQSLLSADDKRDLEAAKALPPAQLFPDTWTRLQRATKFEVLGSVAARHWGPRMLSAGVEGPLFSSLSTTADAPTLEAFFTTLRQDVAAARERKGGTSSAPLRNLAGGGWEDHVAAQRDELLRQLDQGFGQRWSRFLEAIEAVAREGGDAREEDRLGSGRLAIVPDLVAAYGVAREVLAARGEVADARRTELANALEAQRVRHKPDEVAWAKAPGGFERGQDPAQVVARAKRVRLYRDVERARIEEFDWGVRELRERFQALELALVEAICGREWAACRAEIDDFASGKALKAWNEMVAGYPFDPAAADEADGDELAAAIRGMAELAEQIQKLDPPTAFVLDPTFVAARDGAAALARMLYPGGKVQDAPSIDLRLGVQIGGRAIQSVRLQGQGRRAEVGPPVEWRLGVREPLDLTIQLDGGVASFADLVAVRHPIPPAVLLGRQIRQGIWPLRRLFDMGEITVHDERTRISTLQLAGRPDDRLQLVVQVAPESAPLFDLSWPDARFGAVQRIWKP